MPTAGQPPGGQPSGAGGPLDPKKELTPEERAAFQRRSDELGKRVEDAKGTSKSLPARPSGRGKVDGSAMGKAMRVSTELIGGILVGAGLGYLLDLWLGTIPLFFIVFFLLGAAAGMVNVVRGSAPKPGVAAGKSAPTANTDDDAGD